MNTFIFYKLKEKPIEFFLGFAALSVITALLIKAIFIVDMSYDSWAYHFPFASRLWGITTPDAYYFSDRLEYLYRGFPLLGEFLQGFLWHTLKRIEAANLVSFSSLIILLIFLKAYFKIPLYLSTLALLAVPLVQIHATSSYVDLPGNIALSVLILLNYLLYTRNNFLNIRNIFFIFLSAACAANIKFQLIPVVFLVLCFTGLKLTLIVLNKGNQNEYTPIKLPYLVIIILFALPITFFTPIKNLFIHANPVYPIKLQIGHIVLNHEEEPYASAPLKLKNALPSTRWIYSILEVHLSSYSNKHARWSIDQWTPPDSTGYRMGGFFGLYVIFHIGILIYLLLKIRSREAITGGLMLVLLSLIASIMPQSHELRYYMFWMISLISLNLYLVSLLPLPDKRFNLINNQTIGIACLIALLVVADNSNIRSNLYSVDKLIFKKTKDEITSQIDINSHVCISQEKTAPWTFLYASIFHPPKTYSLIAAGSIEECGTYKIIGW